MTDDTTNKPEETNSNLNANKDSTKPMKVIIENLDELDEIKEEYPLYDTNNLEDIKTAEISLGDSIMNNSNAGQQQVLKKSSENDDISKAKKKENEDNTSMGTIEDLRNLNPTINNLYPLGDEKELTTLKTLDTLETNNTQKKKLKPNRKKKKYAKPDAKQTIIKGSKKELEDLKASNSLHQLNGGSTKKKKRPSKKDFVKKINNLANEPVNSNNKPPDNKLGAKKKFAIEGKKSNKRQRKK